MNPVVRRTWAPTGQTPIFYRRGRSHTKVTVLGAICARPGSRTQPRLYFRILQGENADAAACVAFLQQLAANVRGNLFVIWDRLAAHRSKSVRQFLAKHPRIRIYYFPSYAPELNPIEYAWGYLKTNPLANHAPKTKEDLFHGAKAGLCRTRRKRNLLRSFILHSGLEFF